MTFAGNSSSYNWITLTSESLANSVSINTKIAFYGPFYA